MLSERRRRGRPAAAARTHECTECGKLFATMKQLVQHLSTHSEERPFRCEQCGKTYKQGGHLHEHLLAHAGQRSYACSVCEKRFIRNSHLAAHAKTHTGEKPFACETCGREFRQRCQLVVHRRTHTGDRPYRCDVRGNFHTSFTFSFTFYHRFSKSVCNSECPLVQYRCAVHGNFHIRTFSFSLYQIWTWCASGCVVECRICNREVAGSNLGRGCFVPRSTQPSIPPGSVNEYQLRLGSQRQLWLIPIVNEMQVSR